MLRRQTRLPRGFFRICTPAARQDGLVSIETTNRLAPAADTLTSGGPSMGANVDSDNAEFFAHVVTVPPKRRVYLYRKQPAEPELHEPDKQHRTA